MNDDTRAVIFSISSEMEDPLCAISDLIDAISIMAETFDDKEGPPVLRLTRIGAGLIKELKESQVTIYKLSHK